MNSESPEQHSRALSPGAMLRIAREARELSAREVAEQLNWLPSYVAIIEADEHARLSRPALARGYVRAYGKLLGVDETALLAALDDLARATAPATGRRAGGKRSPARQRTGLGVMLGLSILALLVLALWWWRGEGAQRTAAVPPAPTPEYVTGEE